MSDTQPTVPLPLTPPQPAPPQPERRRRRFWPWIAAAIVVALAVGAWFAGEAIARDVVSRTIREQIIAQLDLPADQQIDVGLEGAVLPQLISGALDDVTVSSDDVTVGALTGDVTVRAQGVPIRGDAAARAGEATVRLDTEQVRGLLDTIDAIPTDTVGLEEPDVTMSMEFTFFGLKVPIGVGLTPSVAGGDLVLSPSRLKVAGADLTADAVRKQFGTAVGAILRDYTVCIAEYIPAGVTLSSVNVDGDELVAELDIDGGIINDPALQENGTCP